MSENPLKNNMKVLTFKPPKFDKPVTVGVVRKVRLPLLEQLSALKELNEAGQSSVRIISPALADTCLASSRRGFFAAAGRFLTSGIVFYPNVFCILDDSRLCGSPFLSFESGKRVLLDSRLFDLSLFGENHALMIADVSQCGFSQNRNEIRITSFRQDPINVNFPLSSAWYELHQHHSWEGIPTGKFSGNPGDVKGTPASGLRLFVLASGPTVSPIMRAARDRNGAVVYLDAKLTEPAGMVVEIPDNDVAKFACKPQ